MVVSSAGLRRRAELTTPSATNRNGSIVFDVADTPPLRGGECAPKTLSKKLKVAALLHKGFCAFCVLPPSSSSSARDVHFQSRRPVLEFIRVIEVRAAGGAGVRPWDGGNQAQRNIERVFGLEVAPVEDDFPADDFVSIDPAGLDQFFELIVPDFQTTWNSHDGHRSGDRLIAPVGDGYDGFGDTSLLNLRILKNDLKADLRFPGRVGKQAVVLDADRERHTRAVFHLERNRVQQPASRLCQGSAGRPSGRS